MKSLHFQLTRTEFGCPWGFRIQGGRDFNRPVVICRVTYNTIADLKGLKCGDQIFRINGETTTSLTHNEAQQQIIHSGDNLTLDIIRMASVDDEINTNRALESFPSHNSSLSENSMKSLSKRSAIPDIYMGHSNFDLKYRSSVCNKCQKEIRGPFIIVLDYCFCPDHFKCHYCQSDLMRQDFVEVNGLFYCVKDYTNLLAPNCNKCNKPIVNEEIKVANSKWHRSCFNCTKCGINLEMKRFKIGDDNLMYCEDDWNELFHTRCKQCNQPIFVSDKFLEFEFSSYHAKCFYCTSCKTPLDGKTFHNKNGKPFCMLHGLRNPVLVIR